MESELGIFVNLTVKRLTRGGKAWVTEELGRARPLLQDIKGHVRAECYYLTLQIITQVFMTTFNFYNRPTGLDMATQYSPRFKEARTCLT